MIDLTTLAEICEVKGLKTIAELIAEDFAGQAFLMMNRGTSKIIQKKHTRLICLVKDRKVFFYSSTIGMKTLKAVKMVFFL